MSDKATSPEPELDAAVNSVLEQALAAYDQALHAGDEVGVARARLVLCRELRGCGWEAPPVVVGQMLRDHAMLEPTAIDITDLALDGPERAVSPGPVEHSTY